MKYKIKLRFSLVVFGYGGAERILLDLFQHLSLQEFEIELFLFERTGNYLPNLPKQIKIKYLLDPSNYCNKSIYYKYLRKISYRCLMYFPRLVYRLAGCSHCDIDVAFIQDTTYLLNANLANKKVAWIHNNIEHSPTFNRGLKDNLANADQIICVSNGVMDNLLTHFPQFRSITQTIYNPSIIENIISKSSEYNVTYSKPTIIAVGRLKEQKGFNILVKAFKIIVDNGFDWDLKILGDGELFVEIQNQINQLFISRNIELMGHLDNPYPYIKNANLFVLSSLWEGFGQVVVEALALGVNIVATDCNFGPREIINDGQLGVLVPVGDVISLADAIIKSMTSTNNQSEILLNKRVSRAYEFDIHSTVKLIEKLFTKLVSEKN